MRVAIIFFLLFSLSACTSKLAYDNLDWWVYWYLDDYVELSDEQEERFDDYLTNWLQWHKRSELKRYENQLKTLKQQVLNSELDYDTVYAHINDVRTHWERVRAEISPELAELAVDLTDQQIVSLFATLEKDNKEEEEEHKEFLEQSEAERTEKRIERMTDNVEERIGDLSDEQKQIIATYNAQFVSTSDEWLQYRRKIQNAARRLFINKTTNPNFIRDLTYLMQNPDKYRSEDYQQASAHNMKVGATMIVEVASTLSDSQKKTLVENIDEYITTIDKFQK
ncbi:DUF6279 family lipoprotein [Alteromonas sp. A081]|uniref:DUF6279 family lipoprotein n=1 Tax=Alteromonas sp. A081 TaxID=3410269 RepID=UPI003B983B38